MTRRSARAAVAICLAGALSLAVTACVPEPDATPTPRSTAAPTAAVSPTPTPTAAPEPTADVALPASCEQLYSPEMLAALQDQIPPLNDPAVTMLSTQDTTGLELLDTGVTTIRCSWGPPSDQGMSTNVSLVDSAAASRVETSLREAGFVCDDSPDGTVCTTEERGVDLDDTEYVLGEVHAFPEGGWVATRWINVMPEGYTDDILTTVWG